MRPVLRAWACAFRTQSTLETGDFILFNFGFDFFFDFAKKTCIGFLLSSFLRKQFESKTERDPTSSRPRQVLLFVPHARIVKRGRPANFVPRRFRGAAARYAANITVFTAQGKKTKKTGFDEITLGKHCFFIAFCFRTVYAPDRFFFGFELVFFYFFIFFA